MLNDAISPPSITIALANAAPGAIPTFKWRLRCCVESINSPFLSNPSEPPRENGASKPVLPTAENSSPKMRPTTRCRVVENVILRCRHRVPSSKVLKILESLSGLIWNARCPIGRHEREDDKPNQTH